MDKLAAQSTAVVGTHATPLSKSGQDTGLFHGAQKEPEEKHEECQQETTYSPSFWKETSKALVLLLKAARSQLISRNKGTLQTCDIFLILKTTVYAHHQPGMLTTDVANKSLKHLLGLKLPGMILTFSQENGNPIWLKTLP